MSLFVKICGLKTPDALEAALTGGAGMVGFVFYPPPSPRHLTPAAAGDLLGLVPSGVDRVGLFVDPTNDEIAEVLKRAPMDLLQLHGAESPERVADLKTRFRLPIIKAIKIAEKDDLAQAKPYETLVDWLLFDAKAPKGMANALPGGNGISFDWTLLKSYRAARPWLLSGGLRADNLGEAVEKSGAYSVDISSGVESRPGEKDAALIEAFLKLAATLRNGSPK